MSSCFETKSGMIECFSVSTDNKYNLLIFNENLVSQGQQELETFGGGQSTFHGCIHL